VKLRVVDVRFVHPKINKKASLVMMHVRNGSKSMMNVYPPLITFENEDFSIEAKKIFKKANTKSVKCKI
jgi:tRNA1(Val) A37 N6-methylase TrmN6